MGRVDPDDDRIRRFVVSHYRYDHGRHERRHVVVAAFDTKREFKACMEQVDAEIEARRVRNAPVEPNEHVMGVELEPGYRRKQQNARLVERALRHGVLPDLENLELPSRSWLLRDEFRPWRRRLARRLSFWFRSRF
jgi:hypothetical protein